MPPKSRKKNDPNPFVLEEEIEETKSDTVDLGDGGAIKTAIDAAVIQVGARCTLGVENGVSVPSQ